MGLDEDDALAILQPSNAELMQALMVLSSAYSDGMTSAKPQTDVMVQSEGQRSKLSICFFRPQGLQGTNKVNVRLD